MSVQRLEPFRDAAELRAATGRLIETVAAMPPESVAGPSLLPGWTRGHVLAHLARNADSLVNLMSWARTGVEIPQYGSGDSRDQDIEQGAGRTHAEHLDDLRHSADRLARAIDGLPPRKWAAQVVMRSGQAIAAAEIPCIRLTEVSYHHVDLGLEYTFAHLPEAFAARELGAVVDGLSGHEGVAAVRLHDTDSGEKWSIGAAADPELTVDGPRHALLAWLSGRSDGEGLGVRPQRPLPALPPLG